MKDAPRLSVIILNWNGKVLLDDCLKALAAQSFRDFEVVLLDNGSADGSAAHVRAHYPWVTLIELESNIGFAGGNNRALAECRGNFIITLNNDTKVAPEFLGALLEIAESDARIGMVAAKMVNFYDTRVIDSIGTKVSTNGMGYNIGVGEIDEGQYDEPASVFGPCAGAALYRRAMLEEVGFFDEDFFAYYEDLDLAWRAQLSGWRCVTAPSALVYHIRSATSGRGSPITVYYIQRNKWYTLVKNWPARLLLQKAWRILVYDLASLGLAILQGRGGAALRARIDVLRNLRKLLQKRTTVQSLRKVSIPDVAALLSPGERALRTLMRKSRESRSLR